MQTGLPPIYNENTEILILGSAPSVQSLAKQQYYGNKTNQFWEIIFTCLKVTDPKNYEKRIQVLLNHHIGLWDIFHTFERSGSMDHHFTQYEINDFTSLLENTSIKTIIANGKTAYHEIVANHLFPERSVYCCLSTSGANNSRKQKRQIEWQQALNKTNQTYFGNNTWIRAAAYYLRYQVFVLEQKIAPSLEFDEKTNTIHNYLVVLNQKEPVATIRFDIYKNHTISPDRFCVAKSVRNQGIGSSLLNDFEKKALGLGYKYSLLSAEKQAIPFYQKNGYQIASEEYLEDGDLLCTNEKNVKSLNPSFVF